ncbi:MAG: threonylcarbamoyl-AMP synthase [Ruminococcaceae bacterium]|nr:threonylcarbamoyl-AMP synthase [Oscillospiraceae bacterium]
MGKVYACDSSENIKTAVSKCVEALKNGGLAVFPTETVYGIGVDALNEEAVKSLYEKKQRPYDKPLLMHISSLEMAEEIAVLDDNARHLIKKYTPGPLTLVVKRKPVLPSIAVSGGDTVGLRFPSNKIFLEISKAFGKPIAATSANISGEKSVARAQELKSISDVADVIIDGGECELGLESTIVSLVGEKAKILRLGSFPKEKVSEVLGECD